MSCSNNINKKQKPILAITSGEPAGIGPEIVIQAAWRLRHHVHSVLLGDAALLTQIAHILNPAITLSILSLKAFWQNNNLPRFSKNRLIIIDCPVKKPVIPGILDARNGLAVLKMLNVAIDGALQQRFTAIVTAPLQKSTINDAGFFFTGHTEYLAQRTGIQKAVMMLINHQKPLIRIALATTHLALKEVSAAITFNSLNDILNVIHNDLRNKFNIPKPRILITGLNPHAGEHGYLGREEIDIIIPVITAAQNRHINVTGPYPADTLFQHKYLQDADCILTMYHDQGLPVLKFTSFNKGGTNITLGLPIIRTSVDHGTALSLAAQGPGHANYNSIISAIMTATYLAKIKNKI